MVDDDSGVDDGDDEDGDDEAVLSAALTQCAVTSSMHASDGIVHGKPPTLTVNDGDSGDAECDVDVECFTNASKQTLARM